MRRIVSIAVLLVTLAAPAVAKNGEVDFSGFAAVEVRWFPDDPAFADQLSGGQASLILSPEWEWEGEQRRQQVRFHVMDANGGHSQCHGQSMAEGCPHHDGAQQAGSGGVGDAVEIPQVPAARCQQLPGQGH